jgi:hypothetical protein
MLSDSKENNRLAIFFRDISTIAHPIIASFIPSIFTSVPNLE